MNFCDFHPYLKAVVSSIANPQPVSKLKKNPTGPFSAQEVSRTAATGLFFGTTGAGVTTESVLNGRY